MRKSVTYTGWLEIFSVNFQWHRGHDERHKAGPCFPVSHLSSFTHSLLHVLSFFLSFLLYLSIHPSVHLSSISSLYSPSKSVATASYISTLPAPPASFLSRRLVLQHRRRSFFPAIRKRVLPARKHHRPRSSCLVLPLPPLSLSFSSNFDSASQVVSRLFPKFQR